MNQYVERHLNATCSDCMLKADNGQLGISGKELNDRLNEARERND